MAIVVRNLNVRGKVVVGPPVVIPSGPATQGPNNPGAAVDLGNGDDFWVDVNNILTSNNQYTTCIASSPGNYMSYLLVYNFGFSIPTLATIDGIEVKIEAKDSIGGSGFNYVELWKGSSFSTGTSYGMIPANIVLTTSDVIYTVGGPTDKWPGFTSDWNTQTMTADIINQTDGIEFGVLLGGDSFSSTISIDNITMKVYYTIWIFNNIWEEV